MAVYDNINSQLFDEGNTTTVLFFSNVGISKPLPANQQGKCVVDADVLQLLWKTCLVGAGPDGKHKALKAVIIVLDLPPPQPGSMLGLTSVDRMSASDPKSALALQGLVQAAVWFLGENANYAASEYAWESAIPPGTGDFYHRIHCVYFALLCGTSPPDFFYFFSFCISGNVPKSTPCFF